MQLELLLLRMPRDVQDQVGWGPGQPGLVPDLEVDGPDCSRQGGT